MSFFRLKPDMRVIEITPGNDGWYSEILAPYLRAQSHYVAAIVDHPRALPEGDIAFHQAGVAVE